MSLQGLLSVRSITSTSQFGIISKLATGASASCVLTLSFDQGSQVSEAGLSLCEPLLTGPDDHVVLSVSANSAQNGLSPFLPLFFNRKSRIILRVAFKSSPGEPLVTAASLMSPHLLKPFEAEPSASCSPNVLWTCLAVCWAVSPEGHWERQLSPFDLHWLFLPVLQPLVPLAQLSQQ